MILDLLNPANWFGQGRVKISGGSGNEDWSPSAGGTYANKRVTLETALQLSAFWAAVKLTSETIGTLPLVLYARQDDGGRVPARDQALYDVLRYRPNADQTSVEFWEGMAAWMLCRGNAFSEIARRGDSQVAALLPPMPADQVTVRRSDVGGKEYRFNDRGKVVVLPEEKVFHLRGFGFAGDLGLSVIQYARQTLGSAMAAEEASGSTFANGMRPSGFFKADLPNNGLLTAEQRARAREVLIDPYTGAGNTARVGLLEGPFSWMPVTLSAEDNQLLQTRGFNVEDVCRWVGVPPVLIGHASSGQTMWGTGIEQIMLGWLTLSLRAKLRRVQESVNRALIAPADRGRLYAEYVVDALLQADSAARGELYWKLAQLAAMTPNQIAQKENFPTFVGGDVRLVNSTLLPLDKAGADRVVQVKGGGPNAGSPFDNDEWKAFDPGQLRDALGKWSRGGGRKKLRRHVGRSWKLKSGKTIRHGMGEVKNHEAVKAETGVDIAGYQRVIDSGAIRKTKKKHGNANVEADRRPPQKAIRQSDFEKIPEIIERAHSITGGHVPRKGQTTSIKYEAHIGLHTYTYVESVRTGQRHVALKTMWKKLRR